MKHSIYHLHTISALHVGTGQGIGVIDMPIARERASNLPHIPGSGIKGVLRDELNPCYGNDDEKEKLTEDDYLALFGPEVDAKASEYAGAIAVGDAHLLCLPIRSWKGTFAWVTCPMILRRYQRDLAEMEKNPDIPDTIPSVETNPACYVDYPIENEIKTKLLGEDKVYLEDLDLKAGSGAEGWADFISEQIFKGEWEEIFKERFLIVHDDIFDFLSETATEIRARIKIEEGTRTVKEGALWYEEYLPAETLLWGEVATDRSRKPEHSKTDEELLKMIPREKRLHIGGNATVGAGITRWIKEGET